MIREQYLNKCSPDLLIFLKERGLTTLEDIGTSFGSRGCYTCGDPRHIKRYCPLRKPVQSAQGMVDLDGVKVNQDTHPASEVGSNEGDEHPMSSGGSLRSSDDDHKRESLHMGQAGICLPQDRVEEELTSYIQATMKHMPVVQGRLLKGNESQDVSVLRDTGCTTCVVKAGLIEDSQLTGVRQSMVLIDGSVKEFPVAKVVIDCPCYEGEIGALCMPNALCDVVICNVAGVRLSHDFELQGNHMEGEGVKEDGEQVSVIHSDALKDDPQVMVVEAQSHEEGDVPVNSVLSFWATTDPATVDKLRVYRRAYEVSVLRIARFVFATATNINGMHVCLQYVTYNMYTGSTANLANDFLTRNRTSQELAATCKYAFCKFLLFEYLLLLIITNYVV